MRLARALAPLRRITSSGRYVPEIDGLRFAAITAVVLYHLHGFVWVNRAAADAHDALGAFAGHGYRGVNLFYAISGFILGLPFAAQYLNGERPVRLGRYFGRRLTRLEPPYILSLLICFALLVAGGEGARALLPHLGASMVYLHNLWFGGPSPILPVAWTLEVEVQFYCLAPLLAMVFRIRPAGARRALLAGFILLAGMVQMRYWNAPDRARLTILFAIQFFAAGLWLADVYTTDWKGQAAGHWGWDVASLVCWPAIFWPGDRAVWIYLPFAIMAACIGAFRGVLFHGVFRNPVVTTIGGMCYSIYLFHYLLIPEVLRFSKAARVGRSLDLYFVVQFFIYAPILLAISGVYYVLVERPSMARDWPRRVWQRMAGAPAWPYN